MPNLFGVRFKFPGNGRRLLFQGSAGLVLGVILGLALLGLIGLPGITESPTLVGHGRLLRFSSNEDLKNFLNASLTSPYNNYYRVLFEASKSGSVADVEYSQTNIQVEGVDEADIVKTDGEYIYYTSGRGIVIARVYPPEDAQILSQIDINGTAIGLFINGDRLVVFEESSEFWIYRTEGAAKAAIYPWFGNAETRIKIYNVGDRENPTLVREISVNGSYFASRMIGTNVYVVVSIPVHILDGEPSLPVIKYDNHIEKVEASKIYYSNVTDFSYAFTTIVAVDVSELEAPKYEVLLVGATSAVYVSKEKLYVAIPKTEFLNEGSSVREETEIHKIRIVDDEIEYETSGTVPGRVLNQFSMDEYDGYFRIATTTGHLMWFSGETSLKNNVYVLDANLNITGKIEDIAPGENIYSARFMGERGYLVTFKKVDPFFVIDLSDPTDPEILGKLKITGYSDYLHPYDKDHIIGIGKETVEAEEGDFAWYQGVKISLFDVSDVSSPVQIDKYEIGDRGTDSPILWDHKALLFDKRRNLLAIPVLVAEIDESKYPEGVPSNAYGDYVWQGLYVFRISQSGLELKGRISHIENWQEYLKSGYYFDSYYTVKRALFIEDVLYTVSDRKIKMNSLSDLSEIGELELPKALLSPLGESDSSS